MIEYTYRGVVVQKRGCWHHIPRLDNRRVLSEMHAEKAIDAALDELACAEVQEASEPRTLVAST